MKSSLTSLDCLALAVELRGFAGARFDKAFQPSKDDVVLRLRVAGEGTRELRIKAGRWCFLAQGTKEWPEALTPFAQQLRSHLDGARLAGVRQVAFDRVLELAFESTKGAYILALEFFGEGNVVLVKEGKVVQGLRFLRVAHRTIRPGEPWVPPPSRFDPLAATVAELLGKVLGSKADAVRTLANEWNLGGQTGEELCLRAGVDKRTKAAKLDEAQRTALVQAWHALRRQVEEQLEPIVVRDGAAIVDAAPVPLRVLEEHSFEARGSFQQALEDHFTAYAKTHEAPEDPRVAALQAEADRLRRQAEAQEGSIAAHEVVVEEERAIGDLLYGRYQELEAFLAAAKAKVQAGGFAALEGWGDGPFRVRAHDGAEGTVKVSLEGHEGREFDLLVAGDVHANAERHYERSKRSKEKAEGARAALLQTKEQAARLERDGMALSEKLAKERAKRKYEPTKKLWYEAYRWFISSEGHLVLGGRDAGSNDKLVKKHLETNDRYVHAEQAGAPSVVVKKGDIPEVGEETLREAAEFAVVHSKAWARRIGSAEAYWVTPEQVSKTPMAGEYLARGAFIVRGKRNFLSSPLRMAVGECEVEGHRKVMGGPVSAVQARSQRYVVLEPGQENANDLAKALSEAFQVPIEEVQAVLPPGPVRVVEAEGVSLGA
jgi:predicted ribosome quality control (RQC) complex YloA/Tae2 family protein